MDATPKTRKSLWDGLTRILHLHQLPRSSSSALMVPEKNPWNNAPPVGRDIPVLRPPISSPMVTSRADVNGSIPPRKPEPIPAKAAAPIKAPVVPSKPAVAAPPRAVVTQPSYVTSTPLPANQETVSNIPIVTDYDRIYDLVKSKQSIKLDEIARVLALKEERVAQELQTLEDNGMVEVRYPAFGEPLIVYKKPES